MYIVMSSLHRVVKHMHTNYLRCCCQNTMMMHSQKQANPRCMMRSGIMYAISHHQRRTTTTLPHMARINTPQGNTQIRAPLYIRALYTITIINRHLSVQTTTTTNDRSSSILFIPTTTVLAVRNHLLLLLGFYLLPLLPCVTAGLKPTFVLE